MLRECRTDGCTTAARAKGLCNRHYKESRKPTPANLCVCGCGELALTRFVSGHNTRTLPGVEQMRRGRLNDGSALRDRGEGKTYRKVGQRHEHRAVAEQAMGRSLLPGEIVHHINGNARDNRPENLQVMTQAEHAREHHAEMMAARKAKRGY